MLLLDCKLYVSGMKCRTMELLINLSIGQLFYSRTEVLDLQDCRVLPYPRSYCGDSDQPLAMPRSAAKGAASGIVFRQPAKYQFCLCYMLLEKLD